MSKDFKFSVVVPIYNVEEYLEEALDSVINQTLNFKRHIQLILINDGSADGSEAICLRYQQKYPKNILYIAKENGGVSSARNTGIDYAIGKYLVFLDPDDKWEAGSFKNAYNFFEAHYDEIDVLSARVKFFEARDDYHTFDYKFENGTRIADLSMPEEFYSGQSTAATTFIKREAVGDLRFDCHLKYGEDSIFINKLILKKGKYGLINEALYLYRRRDAGDSAVNKQIYDKAFYIDTLRNYHLELIEYSRRRFGEVIPYVQAMISYDIYWRFTQNAYKQVLNDEETEQFKALSKQVLSNIEDRILLSVPIHTTILRKSAVIKFKYGVDLASSLKFDAENQALKFNDVILYKINKSKSKCCLVGKAEVADGLIILDIFVACWILKSENGNVRFIVKLGEDKAVPEKLTDYHGVTVKNSDGIDENYYYHYHIEYPVDGLEAGGILKIEPYLEFENGACNISMNYGKFVTNKVQFPEAYQFYGRYLLRCYKNSILLSCPANPEKTRDVLESRCLKYLNENGLENIAEIRKRFKDFEAREAPKGKVWIFADRIDNAGDNAEAIFKYTCEHKPKGVRPIFMIGQNAEKNVIDRLKSEGEVIFAQDERYPYFFLMAEKIISSSAGEFTINPFDSFRPYLNDMFKFRYYFTNHGVNCGDCSKWLNKFNKKIDVFFTTGANETKRIIDDGYLYTEDQLVITGLPRYDLLYEDSKKQIMVLPTWRRAIKKSYDANTSSVYFDGFKNTDFFKFYNGLINDERLLAKMREKGYKGIFCLHPIHMKQSVDFKGNDVFRINDGFIDYNKVFAESSILVTDYSTIAFDFAHLKKPIVYSQFDKDEFYANQIYDQGFFDYEINGFGPVCYDMDSVVDELTALIDNDCENRYLDRVEDFFVYLDNDNCKRVYDKLVSEM